MQVFVCLTGILSPEVDILLNSAYVIRWHFSAYLVTVDSRKIYLYQHRQQRQQISVSLLSRQTT